MPAIRNTRMHSQRVDQIGESGVIAILRGVDPESAIDVATAVIDGGVTALEVTADTPNVAETIGSLSDRFDDVLVGAGTVLDAETARAVQLAGAEFLVTPTVDVGVIETGNRYATPVATGAFTPTEAIRAYEAGADFVKVFPAATGGPGHVAAPVARSRRSRWCRPAESAPRTPVRISRREPRRSESEAQSLLTMPSRTRSTRLSPRTRAEPSMRSRPPGTDSPSVDQAIRDRNSEIRSVSRWVARETAPTASSSIDRSPSVVQSSRRRLVPSAAEADREDVSLGNRPPLPCGARF